jgi:high mobility group AT-hook protein 2
VLYRFLDVHKPTTGAVSPQCHVVYNELFTSVHGHLTDAVFNAEEWNDMLRLKGLEYNVNPIDEPGDQLAPFFDEFVHVTDPLTDPPVPEGDTEDETKTETTLTLDEDEEGTSKLPVAPNPSPTLIRGQPRGRPPKHPLLQESEGAIPRRPRGRPRKNPQPDENAPQRPRGRPRKHPPPLEAKLMQYQNVHEDDHESILCLQ